MTTRLWGRAGVAGALFGVVVLSAGCFRAQARTTPTVMPDLTVPAPPPRIVDPVVAQVPEPVGLADQPPQNTPIPPPPAPPSRADTSKPDPSRTEPVVTDQPRAEAPRAPQTTLQTTPVEQEADVARKILDLLNKAGTDLTRVDYNRLNADARTQYDQAKRFASQADEALKARNLVFASYLADKAAALAAQLAGR
jgi:hypothetical protein